MIFCAASVIPQPGVISDPATGLPIAAYVIGPGREVHDTYDDWARLSEVAEDGCVLVRLDAHVGWRAATLAPDPPAALEHALEQILGRRGASTPE